MILFTSKAEDELIVLLSNRHPLADRGHVALKELAEDHFAIMNSGNGMRELVDGFCVRAGFKPKVFYEGSEGDIAMSLLKENICIFILPASVHFWKVQNDYNIFSDRKSSVYRPPITALRLTDPCCKFSYGVSTLKDKDMSSGAREFYDMILEYFSDWSGRWENVNLKDF